LNPKIVTTGLVPLAITSNELFEHQPFQNELPWNLAGGSANLLLTDPTGVTITLPATIGADGVARVNWTVTGPAGTWLRAWDVTDNTGIHQRGLPIPFSVISSPS